MEEVKSQISKNKLSPLTESSAKTYEKSVEFTPKLLKSIDQKQEALATTAKGGNSGDGKKQIEMEEDDLRVDDTSCSESDNQSPSPI